MIKLQPELKAATYRSNHSIIEYAWNVVFSSDDLLRSSHIIT